MPDLTGIEVAILIRKMQLNGMYPNSCKIALLSGDSFENI